VIIAILFILASISNRLGLWDANHRFHKALEATAGSSPAALFGLKFPLELRRHYSHGDGKAPGLTRILPDIVGEI
jgi:hypothetical protein